MMRPYEKEIIALIESGIKNIEPNDIPYDVARDIYDSITEYLIQIYDEGYSDGLYEREE